MCFSSQLRGLEDMSSSNADVSTDMLLPERGKKETNSGSLVEFEEKKAKKQNKTTKQYKVMHRYNG